MGDIHARADSLAAVLAYFATQRVDGVIAVGELVDGTGDVDRCVELLRGVDAQVVAGNYERWFLRDEMRMLREITPRSAVTDATFAWLAALPKRRTFETAAGVLLLCHGVGANDMAAVHPDEPEYIVRQRSAVDAIRSIGDVDIVLGGHTHQRMVRRIDPVTFVNAGTLAPADSPCCAVIDFERREVAFSDVVDGGVRAAERVAFPTR